MSSELILDNSKEVFKLDKEVISFNFSLENLSEQEPVKSPINSENEIKVTNLTEDFLAFRIKVTKKAYYSVQPTYCIIPPKELKTITIKFFLKEGEIPKFHGHKFKFEGFIIPEKEKDKDAKILFNEYTQKAAPVVGKSQKTFVQFPSNNEIQEKSKNNNLLQLPKKEVSHVRSGSDISEYVDIDEKDENYLLMEKIQSKDEQNPILSDIISGGELKIIEEEKKDNKKEEIKNDIIEDSIKNQKNENDNNHNIEKKLETVSEQIAKSINDNLNKDEKFNKKEMEVLEEAKQNLNLEANNNIFKDELFENRPKDVGDILTFIALFIAMLFGYYLVK